VYTGWPIPALLLFAAAWVTILVALVVAFVRIVRLWRTWRRGALPPWGTPGAGAPFTAIGRPFLLIAVLCFLAGVLGERYAP
jgi:hypothetical protein